MHYVKYLLFIHVITYEAWAYLVGDGFGVQVIPGGLVPEVNE